MLKFFKENVYEKAKVITDGHPSYPFAVSGIGGEHIVVNHVEGFKNKDGYHTNLIECKWSLFKSDIKTRKGVPGFAMQQYVEEYIWRRRNVTDKTIGTFSIAYINLIKMFFN